MKYNGNLKPLCKHCTGHKHKVLQIKNNEFDSQCKICNKPALYKKCIACSICKHFYHGKCLDLNREDIEKIESICEFFMCQKCNQSILPQQPDTDKRKSKESTKINTDAKNCLTCNKKISKKRYDNKYLIYNNKKRCLCESCSKHGLEIPVRDKTLVEFLDCSICKKQVKYESIFCDHCQHLVHPYCNGISKKYLHQLGQMAEKWYCKNCNLQIYPNFLLTDNNKCDIMTNKNQSAKIKHEFITYDDCSMCSKKVTGIETLACSTCSHWVHKKCIGHFSNRSEYQDFLGYYSSKSWDCPACTSEILPFILLDNDEFKMLLIDIYAKPLYLNKDNFQKVYSKLNETNFCNTTKNNDSDNDKYLDNIDPDKNYQVYDTCEYIVDPKMINAKTSKELTMMTFNIRSIKKNFNKFLELLCTMKCKIHVICLTETWLGNLDNIKDFEIDGYHTPLFQNRQQSTGGGVITYIHKDIDKHKKVQNMSFVDEFNHCLATEITINNSPITFLNIYRSPNNQNDTFIDKFETILEKTTSKTCYILGDMNYNLLNHDKHILTKNYLNMLTSASFKPLITKPTRITETNMTLIDHVCTNNIKTTTMNKSHIIITDITDHLPCVAIIKQSGLLIKGYKTITKRIINDCNRLKFTKKISQIKDILAFQATNRSETNIETKYNNYFDQISKVYNECFPLKTVKIHSKTLSKPWITPDIQKLICNKNKRFSIKNKNKTESNKLKYKKAKKVMESAISKAKDTYYRNLLDKNSKNIKQKWNSIRIIINRQKTQYNNCIIPNNVLGNHYATVAEKLAEKLPKMTIDDLPSASKSSINNCKRKIKHQFNFNTTTEREVYELILQLDTSKGPGTDNLDTKSLKSIANIISAHLASLFNQSIKLGIYPQCIKIAKCVPIFKGSPLDSSLPINYRPISILTTINKTFERILHNQLSKYLEENNLLPPFQYGYRKHHNTSQAIADYTDYINKAINNKQVTIAVFMDLSKAFDTVDKTILKHKLHELGLTELSTSLIDSYMTNRKFCMMGDKEYYKLKYGVPQGSILGPLLFIMYTYDMTQITEHNKVIVYADDTTVLVSGRNLTETKQHCNDILTRFYKYFTINKLSINPDKTKYMVYKPLYRTHSKKKLLHDTTNTKITMEGTPLEQVRTIKFLGVIINDKLTWECHKQLVYNKICKTFGILYKCKQLMTEMESINMYKTFIQPYFLYGIEIWGHTINSDNDILVKLQSKIVRIILGCARSADAWKHCNGHITSIQDLYKNAIKKLCVKHHFGVLPHYFSHCVMPDFNIGQLQNKISHTSLDEMYDYKIPPKLLETNLKANCVDNWNKLPLELKTLPYSSSKHEMYKTIKKFN